MSFQRIGASGSDFTVALYNNNCTLAENTETLVMGFGVVSGLIPSAGSGFTVNVTAGTYTTVTTAVLAVATTWVAPSNTVSYLWLSDAGVFIRTATPTAPGGNVVCLGKIATNGTGVTSISFDGRTDMPQPSVTSSPSGTYQAIPVTGGTLQMFPTQYCTGIIEFTGALTSNQTVYMPNKAGWDWIIVNSTTGAYTLTVQTQYGSGLTCTQGKTSTLWCDGTNIRRATPEV